MGAKAACLGRTVVPSRGARWPTGLRADAGVRLGPGGGPLVCGTPALSRHHCSRAAAWLPGSRHSWELLQHPGKINRPRTLFMKSAYQTKRVLQTEYANITNTVT